MPSKTPKPTDSPVVTLEQVLAVIESGEDSAGFCVACGYQTDGVEPDARKYRCPACERQTVYGAEELLIRMAG